MKVLLVSATEQTFSFNCFISAFRNKIGSCEYLCLAEKQVRAEDKQLFDQYRKSMAFDRFIASYQDERTLKILLPLFSGIKQQTLLSLQIEDEKQRALVAKYARSNPLLRWAGSDRVSFDYYKRIGIDAYMLSPLSRGPYLQNIYKPLNTFHCHIFGDSQDPYIDTLPKTKTVRL